VALCATLIQGAEYARMLGLVDLNVPALRMFLLRTFIDMRLQLNAQSVDLDRAVNIVEILSDYISEVRAANQVLDTNYVFHGAGRPAVPVRQMNRNPFNTTRQLTWNAQLGVEDNILHCRRRHFEDWCYRKEYALSDIFDAMKKHKCVEHLEQGTIGAGLTLEPGMDYLPFGIPSKLLRVELRKLGASAAALTDTGGQT
jgi:hypothetical protein